LIVYLRIDKIAESQSNDLILLSHTFQQTTEKQLMSTSNLSRRSVSPSLRYDAKKKQHCSEVAADITHISPVTHSQEENNLINEGRIENSSNTDAFNKYENISDNGSEISDEGYRSLGIVQSNNPKRVSPQNQASTEYAETNGKSVENKLGVEFFQ